MYVACMTDRRGARRMLVDRHEGKGIGGRKILKWIFKKWGGQAWIELIRLRIGKVGSACECW